MITKICRLQSSQESGIPLIQVFQPGEMEKAAAFFSMGKTAAPLLPAVQAFLSDLRPHPDKIYVLSNALGAGEFWGSNINGDYFTETALIHRGHDYGYETFYGAYPYLHHQNKDPSKSFGTIELSCWHDCMKRVELVIAIDRNKAKLHNAVSVVDKLDHGMYPDLSMGCKVPFDLCSVCTDWNRYRRAQDTFDTRRHKSVGAAVLEEHKRRPITGLSVTRVDYCDHLRKQLNKILPDGRKVYMINTYPKFFDISFVFMGADKTAKVMAKLAGSGYEGSVVPSWYLAEQEGYPSEEETTLDKVASVGRLVQRVKAASHSKAGEIEKDVTPSQFGGKAIPTIHRESDLPDSVLDRLGSSDLSEALSTPTLMGMLLKPREFQRITIIRLGNKPLADELDRKNLVFPPVGESDTSVPMGGDMLSSELKKVLLPFLESRSNFEPVARRRMIRITIIGGPKDGEVREPNMAPDDSFLHKISAAYNGYLDNIVDCYKRSKDAVLDNSDLYEAVYGNMGECFYKSAGAKIDPTVLFGSVGGAYLLSALADQARRKAAYGGGEPVSDLTDMVAEHPNVLMIAAGLAALHQQGSNIPATLMKGLKGLTHAMISR